MLDAQNERIRILAETLKAVVKNGRAVMDRLETAESLVAELSEASLNADEQRYT